MRRGLTLLEVLVALVVLTIVGVSYLQLFSESHHVVGVAQQWSNAVAYAQDAMEHTKLTGKDLQGPLPGGFRRQISRRPFDSGYTIVTITVTMPNGAQYQLNRLTRADSSGAEQW
jgi:prepilin-type N-terminal cleavage/methylation domain-containing protein